MSFFFKYPYLVHYYPPPFFFFFIFFSLSLSLVPSISMLILFCSAVFLFLYKNANTCQRSRANHYTSTINRMLVSEATMTTQKNFQLASYFLTCRQHRQYQ